MYLKYKCASVSFQVQVCVWLSESHSCEHWISPNLLRSHFIRGSMWRPVSCSHTPPAHQMAVSSGVGRTGQVSNRIRRSFHRTQGGYSFKNNESPTLARLIETFCVSVCVLVCKQGHRLLISTCFRQHCKYKNDRAVLNHYWTLYLKICQKSSFSAQINVNTDSLKTIPSWQA